MIDSSVCGEENGHEMIVEIWKPQGKKLVCIRGQVVDGVIQSTVRQLLGSSTIDSKSRKLGNITEDKVKSFMQGLLLHMFFRVYVNGFFQR